MWKIYFLPLLYQNSEISIVRLESKSKELFYFAPGNLICCGEIRAPCQQTAQARHGLSEIRTIQEQHELGRPCSKKHRCTVRTTKGRSLSREPGMIVGHRAVDFRLLLRNVRQVHKRCRRAHS
jgi:hypothetical protein